VLSWCNPKPDLITPGLRRCTLSPTTNIDRLSTYTELTLPLVLFRPSVFPFWGFSIYNTFRYCSTVLVVWTFMHRDFYY